MHGRILVTMATLALLAASLSRAALEPAAAGSAAAVSVDIATGAVLKACSDAGGDAATCGDFVAVWAAAIAQDFGAHAGAITGAQCGSECTLMAGDDRILGPASASQVARGIAHFGVGNSFGGAHHFWARTPAADWQSWIVTQNGGPELTSLPGAMLVGAGGDGLTLRAGPGTDAASLGVLADSTRVTAEEFVLLISA
jgi:hypothetical protein